MGFFLQEHDIYVGSLLDEFNVRFAPGQRHSKSPDMKKTHFGGIEEMVALQTEFGLFKKGRPFMMSVRALNIGAFNLGNASGALLGGVLIDAGFSLRLVPVAAGVVALAAVGTALLGGARDRRARP